MSGEIVPPQLSAQTVTSLVDDPLVELSGLNDGLMLPMMEHEPAHDGGALHLPEMAAVYDFVDGLHLYNHWTFDSHA